MNNKSNKISVILFTGGMDSTVVAHQSKEKGNDVYCLTLSQGGLNSIEVEKSKQLCSHLGVKSIIYDMSSYSDLVDKQVTNSCGYSEGNEDDIVNNFIPNRNAIFILLGHSLCQNIMRRKSVDKGEVLLGMLSSDPDYPDSRLEFFQGMTRVLNMGSLEGTIEVGVPLWDYSKYEVYKYLKENKIPIEMTWSCNENEPIPCGKCYGCTQRKRLNKQYNIQI